MSLRIALSACRERDVTQTSASEATISFIFVRIVRRISYSKIVAKPRQLFARTVDVTLCCGRDGEQPPLKGRALLGRDGRSVERRERVAQIVTDLL